MKNSIESIVISLGNEPAELLGFKTEEQIETALIPLMAEVFQNETIAIKKAIKEKEDGNEIMRI